MSPWGSNSKAILYVENSLINIPAPGMIYQNKLNMTLQTGEIIQIYDQPSSSNDRCSNIMI